jgi:hypothetical protein
MDVASFKNMYVPNMYIAFTADNWIPLLKWAITFQVNNQYSNGLTSSAEESSLKNRVEAYIALRKLARLKKMQKNVSINERAAVAQR